MGQETHTALNKVNQCIQLKEEEELSRYKSECHNLGEKLHLMK